MSKKAKPKKETPATPSGTPIVKNKSAPRKGKADPLSGKAAFLFLGLCALVFLWARIRLLAIPLERDEGSFAYIGHWIWRGRELYTDMLDSKLPGLYGIYGLFTTLFGLSATGVHIALLTANIVSAWCLYALARKIYTPYVAAIATSFYLFLTISLNVVGFAAHATQLLTPFVLAGALLFWQGIDSGRLLRFFLAGLCIGLAFTVKQQAAVLGIVLALLWWPMRLWWNPMKNNRLPWREWVMLGLGGFLPLVSVVLYFALVGRLDEFINWTVLQPIYLADSFAESRTSMFMNILPRVIKGFEGLWILAAVGLVLIFLSGYKKEAAVFGAVFSVAAFASVVIGAAYYQHYFVPALPGIALLAAVALQWLARKAGTVGAISGLGVASILIILSILGRTSYYFNPDYAQIHFKTYNQNMFPELEKLGRDLAKRVPEGQRIAVLGSEPELLVAAGRESCSKHLMVYSLLSDPVRSPPMQQEYIREIQACMPEYIVWSTVSGSWTRGYDQLQFFKQLMQWVETHYLPNGLAESREDKPGVIVWDDALARHQSQSNYRVIVFRRKAQ